MRWLLFLFFSSGLFASISPIYFNDLEAYQQRKALNYELKAQEFPLFVVKDLESKQLPFDFKLLEYEITIFRKKDLGVRTLYEGSIKGDQNSYINIITYGDTISGTLHVEAKTLLLKALGGAVFMLVPQNERLNEDRVYPPSNRLELQSGIQKALSSSGVYIDVLVLYSNDAVAENSAIENEIVSALAYTNQALAQSCADFRYRLTAIKQVAYNDANNIATDLENLRNGAVANALSLRDQYRADLVQLWIQKGGNYCGLAYVNANPSSSVDYAFSVMDSECGGSTMAHELGHNMGLSHDRYANGISAKDYTRYKGYGFIDHLHKVRSIMSYNSECYDLYNQNCPTVPYFSNPNLIRDGVIFGQEGLSDAVGLMNTNRLGVAAFREANNSDTPTISGCQAPQKSEGLSSCFIATAAYGSFLHPYVQTLRDFRDRVLLKFRLGRDFVAWYYAHAPAWADFIRVHPALKFVVQILLAPLVWLIAMPWLVFLFWGLWMIKKRFYKRVS